MNKRRSERLVWLLCLVWSVGTVGAQTTTRHEFTIQQAVEYARKNNVQVKNALLNIQSQQQTNQGTGILQQNHRKFRGTGLVDELEPGPTATGAVGLTNRRPEREALQDDRQDQHPESPGRRRQRLRVLNLVDALVDRKESTDKEQHDCHDEAVEVTRAPETKGVVSVRCPFGPPATDQQQHLVG